MKIDETVIFVFLIIAIIYFCSSKVEGAWWDGKGKSGRRGAWKAATEIKRSVKKAGRDINKAMTPLSIRKAIRASKVQGACARPRGYCTHRGAMLTPGSCGEADGWICRDVKMRKGKMRVSSGFKACAGDTAPSGSGWPNMGTTCSNATMRMNAEAAAAEAEAEAVEFDPDVPTPVQTRQLLKVSQGTLGCIQKCMTQGVGERNNLI